MTVVMIPIRESILFTNFFVGNSYQFRMFFSPTINVLECPRFANELRVTKKLWRALYWVAELGLAVPQIDPRNVQYRHGTFMGNRVTRKPP